MLDLTGSNLAAYILRICRNVVSSNPRFRQTLGDVSAFTSNRVSFGDAQIIVKNVTAQGTRLSPDYFMFTQRGRGLVAKVADKAGTFVEWAIPFNEALIDPGVYYLGVNSINEQNATVSVNVKKFEWREGSLSNAQGSWVYFAPGIDTSTVAITDAVDPSNIITTSVYPGRILLQTIVQDILCNIGAGGLSLMPYRDFWYQRSGSEDIGTTKGGQQVFFIPGIWTQIQVSDSNDYILRPGIDYTFTSPGAIRTAVWQPAGVELYATGVQKVNPTTLLSYASGVLTSITPADVLTGSISFQIGTGTNYTVTMGAAPSGPTPDVFYSGLAAYTMSDLASTINTNTSTIGVSATLGTVPGPDSTILPTLTITETGVGTLKVVSQITAFTVSAMNPENILNITIGPGETLVQNQVFVNTSSQSNVALSVQSDGAVWMPYPLNPGEWMRYEVRIDTGPETTVTVKKRGMNSNLVSGYWIAIGDSVTVGDQVAVIISPQVCETYDVYGSKDNVSFTLDCKANDYSTASEIAETIKKALLITQRVPMERDGITIFEAARDIQGEARDESGTAARYISTLNVSAMCDWKVYLPLVTRVVAIDLQETPYYAGYSSQLYIGPRYTELGMTQFVPPTIITPQLIIEINGVPITA